MKRTTFKATLMKQADIFSRASAGAYRWTYLLTSSNICRIQSCRTTCSTDFFNVLDSAATKFQVQIKESMYIKWEKPNLNQKDKHTGNLNAFLVPSFISGQVREHSVLLL